MFPSDLQRKAAQATSLLADIAAGLNERVGGQPAVELLQELAAAGRQLELGQCLAAEQIDRSGVWQSSGTGASSTVAYLKRETGETGSWVNQRVRLGRALEDALLVTRQVWSDGRIGMEKAAEIAKGVEGLDQEATAKAERILAEDAPGLTIGDLRGLIDSIRTLVDPEVAAEKDKADFARQGFTMSQTTGGWRLSGRLNSEAGTIVNNALERFLTPPSAPAAGEPTPSPKLRRALALTELVRQALAHQQCQSTAAAKPTVIVTVPWDVLKHQLGVGDVEGGGTMPAAAIRRLACDADILPMTLSGDGQILDAGRTRRTVSPAQRIALNVRDRHCRFDGCERPPAWCHGHHIREWMKDHGPTDLDNLLLLCHYHHHLVHEGGWTITGTASRDLTFHPSTNPVRRT